jgi:hypothetical protein
VTGPPALPLVVEVDYAVDDLVEFQKHLQKRLTGWLRWVPWVIFGAMFVVVALLVLLMALSTRDESAGMRSGMISTFKSTSPALAVFVVFFVLLMRRNRRAMRDAFSRPGNMQRHHTFALDAAGVAVREPFFAGHYGWPAILRWAETPNLFVLHYADFDALIIPKRFVAGREEQLRALFRTFIDQRAVVPLAAPALSAGPPPLPAARL